MLIRPRSASPTHASSAVHRAAVPAQVAPKHEVAAAPPASAHAHDVSQAAAHPSEAASSATQRAPVVEGIAGWVRPERVQPTPEAKGPTAPAEQAATSTESAPAQAEPSLAQRSGGGVPELVSGVAGQLRQLGDRARDYVAEKSGLKPNQEEKAHMQAIHDMLGKDRLGGQDGTFNQNDIDAVARSIGGGGLSGKVVSGIAARRMREGLAEQGIKPLKAEADATPRRVSRADMERFQENLKGFEAYGKRIGQTPLGKMLGLDRPKVPPHGLSQDDMRSIMRGQQPKGWVDPKELK